MRWRNRKACRPRQIPLHGATQDQVRIRAKPCQVTYCRHQRRREDGLRCVRSSRAGAIGMRLLLIEDEPDLGDAVSCRLRRIGHTVDRVRSASDAEAALAVARCAIVRLDLGLPDGQGTELLRRRAPPATGAGHHRDSLPRCTSGSCAAQPPLPARGWGLPLLPNRRADRLPDVTRDRPGAHGNPAFAAICPQPEPRHFRLTIPGRACGEPSRTSSVRPPAFALLSC
jgi:hypothetical protein